MSTDSLQKKLAYAERHRKFLALLPVIPLFLFIFLAFIIPVFYMFYKSVDNRLVEKILPNTVPALKIWDGTAPPSDEIYSAMLKDIKAGAKSKTINRIGQRLNYDVSGASSLFRKSARHAKKIDDAIINNPATARSALIGIDKKWADIKTWKTIKKFSARHTPYYYSSAVDFRYDTETDEFAQLPEENRIYISLFIRTFILSATITLLTLLFGYPTAFLLTNIPSKTANMLMILVLLPFWTSLLVRTTSWIVLLQQQGVINDLLVNLGLLDDANRLVMIHNITGTVVAMTHILLPFMILPLYSVMKTIPPSHMRAARSLGAGPALAFWRVYFPQTVPGIGAGGILVFILSIGYYITPELVGGTSGTFISNRIAYHISSSLNWGLGAALGLLLLVSVVVMYLLYDRVVGSNKMKV